MALPVIAVILIKIIAVALTAWLATYLITSSVKMIFGTAAPLAAAVGGWGNVVIIGGIVYAAYAGGIIKL
jgi:hypothetical protein